MFKVLGKIETMMDQSSLITTHHEATLANIRRTMDDYRKIPKNEIVAFRPAPALVTV
jgi:di/tripeptidase